LLPRSGLERSDFVPWPFCDLVRCRHFRRYWVLTGHQLANWCPISVRRNANFPNRSNMIGAFKRVREK
jgi:hypothetical protein